MSLCSKNLGNRGPWKSPFPKMQNNSDAYWSFLVWAIGNVFLYCFRDRPKSRWHFLTWQSYSISGLPLLAWWQHVLLLNLWGMEDRKSHWWKSLQEDNPFKASLSPCKDSQRQRVLFISLLPFVQGRSQNTACFMQHLNIFSRQYFFPSAEKTVFPLIHLFLICISHSPHAHWTLQRIYSYLLLKQWIFLTRQTKNGWQKLLQFLFYVFFSESREYFRNSSIWLRVSLKDRA